MEEAQQALNEIRSHERECALRYERIEERLAEGSNRFQKLEKMIWGVYILIVGSILLAQIKPKKLKRTILIFQPGLYRLVRHWYLAQ